MFIANPIYDVVFKKLMENNKVAKFFIGTILDQTVETVDVKPQEVTYARELAGVAVFRLDFIATIKTATGEYKKILIEIQKSKNPTDLMRFRNYLAEQYKKKEIVNNQEEILPITTVYILGFMLPEIKTPCIKVERNYIDLINKTTLTEKSEYIEKLSHDSYVVQVGRITDRYQTRLDKLLSIFEQSNFTDKNEIIKIYEHEPEIDEIKEMTNILEYVASNSAERKRIEIEIEVWSDIKGMIQDAQYQNKKVIEENEKEIEETKKEIEETKKVVEETKKVIEENEKVIEEKKNEIEEKKKEIAAKDKVLEETRKMMEETRKMMDDFKKMMEEMEEKDKQIEELKRRLKDSD